MTTSVTVEANHGWPVKVTRLRKDGGQDCSIIAAGDRSTFAIWGGLDVRLHEVQPIETPTYGELAVGLSFNPSANSRVERLKALFAEIVDICHDARSDVGSPASPEAKRLYSIAITEAQGAQMWAVKAVTWRE